MCGRVLGLGVMRRRRARRGLVDAMAGSTGMSSGGTGVCCTLVEVLDLDYDPVCVGEFRGEEGLDLEERIRSRTRRVCPMEEWEECGDVGEMAPPLIELIGGRERRAGGDGCHVVCGHELMNTMGLVLAPTVHRTGDWGFEVTIVESGPSTWVGFSLEGQALVLGTFEEVEFDRGDTVGLDIFSYSGAIRSMHQGGFRSGFEGMSAYGQLWSAGDIVSCVCHVATDDHGAEHDSSSDQPQRRVQVEFFRNGISMGTAFGVEGVRGGIHLLMSVGVRESVRVNLGATPFAFPIVGVRSYWEGLSKRETVMGVETLFLRCSVLVEMLVTAAAFVEDPNRRLRVAEAVRRNGVVDVSCVMKNMCEEIVVPIVTDLLNQAMCANDEYLDLSLDRTLRLLLAETCTDLSRDEALARFLIGVGRCATMQSFVGVYSNTAENPKANYLRIALALMRRKDISRIVEEGITLEQSVTSPVDEGNEQPCGKRDQLREFFEGLFSMKRSSTIGEELDRWVYGYGAIDLVVLEKRLSAAADLCLHLQRKVLHTFMKNCPKRSALFFRQLMQRNAGARNTMPPPGLSDSSALVSLYFAFMSVLVEDVLPHDDNAMILSQNAQLRTFCHTMFTSTKSRYSNWTRIGGTLGHLLEEHPDMKCTADLSRRDEELAEETSLNSPISIWNTAMELYHLASSTQVTAWYEAFERLGKEWVTQFDGNRSVSAVVHLDDLLQAYLMRHMTVATEYRRCLMRNMLNLSVGFLNTIGVESSQSLFAFLPEHYVKNAVEIFDFLNNRHILDKGLRAIEGTASLWAEMLRTVLGVTETEDIDAFVCYVPFAFRFAFDQRICSAEVRSKLLWSICYILERPDCLEAVNLKMDFDAFAKSIFDRICDVELFFPCAAILGTSVFSAWDSEEGEPSIGTAMTAWSVDEDLPEGNPVLMEISDSFRRACSRPDSSSLLRSLLDFVCDPILDLFCSISGKSLMDNDTFGSLEESSLHHVEISRRISFTRLLLMVLHGVAVLVFFDSRQRSGDPGSKLISESLKTRVIDIAAFVLERCVPINGTFQCYKDFFDILSERTHGLDQRGMLLGPCIGMFQDMAVVEGEDNFIHRLHSLPSSTHVALLEATTVRTNYASSLFPNL